MSDQISERKPRVVASDKDAPLVLRGAAKEMAETSAQLRRYQQLQAQERQQLLDGAHGEQVKALLTLLRSLTPDAAQGLLQLLERFHWFRDASDDERLVILRLIDNAISRMRVRAGLPPMDDSLPGEDPTVYEICRSNLGSHK